MQLILCLPIKLVIPVANAKGNPLLNPPGIDIRKKLVVIEFHHWRNSSKTDLRPDTAGV